MSQKSCRTCVHATWERTEKRNIRTAHYGQCACPMPELPPIPDSVYLAPPTRSVIWSDRGTECPTYQKTP